MRKGLATIVVTAALAGCGSFAHNADTNGPRLFRPDPARPLVPDVEITDTGPSATDDRQKVSGTSCKNVITDPEPTRDAAIAMMKREAAERGFDAVHSVAFETGFVSLTQNCWASVTASGIAWSRPKPVGKPAGKPVGQ